MKPVHVERWPDSGSSPPVSHVLDACPLSQDYKKLQRADRSDRWEGRMRVGLHKLCWYNFKHNDSLHVVLDIMHNVGFCRSS